MRVEAALALAKMGMNDGLAAAVELVKSSDMSIKSQAINVLAVVGDAGSLAMLNDMYTSEQDPAVKDMLDFARQRLMSAQAAAQQK